MKASATRERSLTVSAHASAHRAARAAAQDVHGEEQVRVLQADGAGGDGQPGQTGHRHRTLHQRYSLVHAQGPVYTKRQRQLCDNVAMTLVILFSLKTMESLENRLQTHSGATPLVSMRAESHSSPPLCR